MEIFHMCTCLRAIALFIVILACINFMNLSTARSANRAKEIGVRKTVGALRYKLMGQFFTESFMYGLIAFVFVVRNCSFVDRALQ